VRKLLTNQGYCYALLNRTLKMSPLVMDMGSLRATKQKWQQFQEQRLHHPYLSGGQSFLFARL
jgi:hypothetical protein